MKHHLRGILLIAAFAAAAEFVPRGSAASVLPQAAATRIFPMPEVEHPLQICAENARVFILDRSEILVYDFRNGGLIRRIGKRGQGPGEFARTLLHMAVLSDRLAVRDYPKRKFFTFEGDYIGEILEPRAQSMLPFLPCGRNYVGFPMELHDDGSYSPPAGWIYDAHLKPLKRFYFDLPESPSPPPPPGELPSGKTDDLIIRDYADYLVQAGNIYVADSRKGFLISVFDENGDALYEIRHSFEKVKVPKGYLETVIKERQASKSWATDFAYKNAIAPEYFPDIAGFKIDADRIYAVRPEQKNGLYEVVVMDLKGKILERSFRFPLKPDWELPMRLSRLYDVEGGKFVWFDYNDAKEMYELHIR